MKVSDRGLRAKDVITAIIFIWHFDAVFKFAFVRDETSIIYCN